MNITEFYVSEGGFAAKPYHYKECGLDNIYLRNGFHIEEVDGEEFVSVDNVDELWKAIGINMVTTQKIIAPNEIRFMRNLMGMTQAEVGGLLRVNDQTVARWEKGQAKLAGASDIAFRALFLACPVAGDEGKKLLSEWLEAISNLIERDSPEQDQHFFTQTRQEWSLDTHVCLAMA